MLEYVADSCCGLTRANGFYNYDSAQDLPRLRELTVSQNSEDGNVYYGCRAVVGTINQTQFEELWPTLEEDGWRLAFRWKNSNSRRNVYLIVFCPDVTFLQQTLTQLEATEPMNPPAPRVVHTWVLTRLRFDESGLVSDESVEVRNFGAVRPNNETVQEHINAYKSNFRRTNTDRMRFELVQRTTVEMG